MMKKTVSKILISFFIVFIFLFGILFIFIPKNEFSETEKRYLAQAPEFSFASLKDGTFTSDFEKYIADQMPFRSFFVSVNSYFELLKGNNGSAGVYLGKDGWLIEKPFARTNKFETNIKRINDFAKNTKRSVSVMLVPSKGAVYGDYLPSNSLDYYDFDYINSIPEKAPDVHSINICSDFAENADKVQLFYKTDHHWTSEGAYVAYNSICKALALKPVPLSDYQKEVTEDFYGTSYSTSCYTLTKPDSITVYRNNLSLGNALVTIEDGSEPQKFSNMFFPDALKTGDKYVVFLNGNHGFERIETENNGGTLLLIKDSFAHCLAPFLAENYSEIIMLDLRYYKKPVTEVIASENISEIMFVYSIDTFAESSDIILR